MRRRRYPMVVPPPVTVPRVPDVVRDKGVKLSGAERRALKAGQGFLFARDGCGFTLLVPPGHPDHGGCAFEVGKLDPVSGRTPRVRPRTLDQVIDEEGG